MIVGARVSLFFFATINKFRDKKFRDNDQRQMLKIFAAAKKVNNQY